MSPSEMDEHMTSNTNTAGETTYEVLSETEEGASKLNRYCVDTNTKARTPATTLLYLS